MGAYAETTTFDLPRVEKISNNLGIISGECDLTNYNTTGAEITDLTGKFKSILRVICDGMSKNGFIPRWNATDKCFHAFYPVTAHTHTISLSATHAGGAIELVAEADASALGNAGGAARTGITGIDNATAAAGGEVANDVDVGEINFFAIGII